MEAVSLSLLIFTVYAFSLLAYCLIKKHEINIIRTVYINSIVLYALLLASLSFLPINYPQDKGFNYIPFAKFIGASDSEMSSLILKSVLAALLFVPAGYFTGMFCKLKAISNAGLYAVMLSLLLSLIIEVAQLYLPFNRICDVDEILFNVIGGFIGVIIFYMMSGGKFMRTVLRHILYY